jgi:hypothetical protein
VRDEAVITACNAYVNYLLIYVEIAVKLKYKYLRVLLAVSAAVAYTLRYHDIEPEISL